MIWSLFREVLDLIYVFLSDFLALLTVVDEEASDGGRDGEENEPVARR